MDTEHRVTPCDVILTCYCCQERKPARDADRFLKWLKRRDTTPWLCNECHEWEELQ